MDNLVLVFQLHPTLFYSLVTILGLLVGSFLNVVIHRLPIMMERGWKREYQAYFHPEQPQEDQAVYNLVVPGSRCPGCHSAIRPWQNIPVLSWLWLKGKCANCHTKISPRYPIVEAITGLASLLVALHFGVTMATLVALLFTWAMIALTAIDFDKMLLPDQICLPLLWLGLLVSIPAYFVESSSAILGAAAGYLVLWTIYWGFKLLTGKEGMGYGDFKLLAAIGAFVGWEHLTVVILLSSVVGAIVGTLYLKLSQQSESRPIPFGPYLAIAGWITLLYGDQIVSAYWHWLLT